MMISSDNLLEYLRTYWNPLQQPYATYAT